MANYVRFERKDGSKGAGQLEGETIRVIEEPFWDSAKATGERLALNAILFPRGIDVVLVDDDRIVAIPRTTRLAAHGA